MLERDSLIVAKIGNITNAIKVWKRSFGFVWIKNSNIHNWLFWIIIQNPDFLGWNSSEKQEEKDDYYFVHTNWKLHLK